MRIFKFALATTFIFGSQAMAAPCPTVEVVNAALMKHIAHPDEDTLTNQMHADLKDVQGLWASLDKLKLPLTLRQHADPKENIRYCSYYVGQYGPNVVNINVKLN